MASGVVIASFAFFLVVFTLIGVLSAKYAESSTDDYLVAGRNMNPWLVALSAVSTNNSGYMFIGLIGFAWRSGIEAMWITFGWIAGDLITWFWVHGKVREQSEKLNVASVPSLLAANTKGVIERPIAAITGLLTFAFLGAYAAAQLKAGSTTLHAIFGWPDWVGAVLGVVIVTVYCMSGGIRASIWTDAAQSIVMIFAMAILVLTCVDHVGGPSALFDALRAIDPKLVDPMPASVLEAFGLYGVGFALYLLGYIVAGSLTIGQPHVLVRFMAIDKVESVKKARTIYFIWFTLFSAAALAVGLYSRALLPDLTAGLAGSAAVAATEGALPMLSVELLPSLLIGVMLAGLFSATMSTADSQILSCSAAVTQDVFPRFRESYLASKIATLSVAGLALVIALVSSSGVFVLVLVAWSALGASLGPILIVRLAKAPLPVPLAIAMMSSGIATVIYWGNSPYAGDVFKALPGFLVPLVVYGLWYVAGWRNEAAATTPPTP